MEIIVNGESKMIEPGTSVEVYIRLLDLDPEAVVVEYDTKIIKREDYKTCILADGGKLELIRFVGGG